MGYRTSINDFFGNPLATLKLNKTLQPKKVAKDLKKVMERKKKVLIDATYAPNVYRIYMCPADIKEIKALLGSLKTQLKKYIQDEIRERNYSLLSNDITIEIESLDGLKRNELQIEALLSDEGKKEEIVQKKSALLRRDEKDEAPGKEEDFEKTIIEEKGTVIRKKVFAQLEVIAGEEEGRIIELLNGDYVFGRGKKADVSFKDKEMLMSREHFRLSLEKGKISLTDLGSANGTYVNSKPAEESEIGNGDEIDCGAIKLRVKVC